MLNDSTADYLLSQNANLYEIADSALMGAPTTISSLCMATRTGDVALVDELNMAIAAIQENGTLDALKAKHINEVIAGAQIETVTLPKIDGADTLRVVVTGDLPPLDFVSADGTATGFNVALLTSSYFTEALRAVTLR